MLERADGVFELYLTEAGESRPVLLTLDLRADELGPIDPESPFNPVVVLTTVLVTPAPGLDPNPGLDPTLVSAVPIVEAIDPSLVSRAGVLDLERVAFDSTVVAPGDQAIAFVVGGEGAEEEPEEGSSKRRDQFRG